MSLTSQELEDVIQEISNRLTGARLRKLNAPVQRTCQLVLGEHVLLLDLNPGKTRVHLIEKKRPAPKIPPAWVMKCRRELEGRFLDSIQKDENERVVRLIFSGGEKRPQRTLLAELFGRRGRLLLLDEDDRVLLALMGRAAAKKSYRPGKSTRQANASSRFEKPDPETLAVNRAVARHYEQSDLQDLKKNLSRSVAREKKRLARRYSKMEDDLKKTGEAVFLSRQGEVLKANLHQVKKGQKRVTLKDPYDPQGQTIQIELDPALDAKQNMKRLFIRSKRLSAARPKIQKRIGRAKEELETIQRLAAELQEASTREELEDLQTQLEKAGLSRPEKKAPKKPQRRLPYKVYRSAKGLRILVGRSGRDNNELTFKVAKGSDLWLHARDAAGAHVVVPLGRNREIDEQTLIDAATLAAASSGLKKDDKVEVTYTKAKNVHPLKGAPPGLVSVAKGRTILVRMEPERLERLKQSIEK